MYQIIFFGIPQTKYTHLVAKYNFTMTTSHMGSFLDHGQVDINYTLLSYPLPPLKTVMMPILVSNTWKQSRLSVYFIWQVCSSFTRKNFSHDNSSKSNNSQDRLLLNVIAGNNIISTNPLKTSANRCSWFFFWNEPIDKKWISAGLLPMHLRFLHMFDNVPNLYHCVNMTIYLILFGFQLLQQISKWMFSFREYWARIVVVHLILSSKKRWQGRS